MPMRVRSRRRPPRSSRHGSPPSTLSAPLVGRSAVPISRSKVVLPAPDGPITATRSPAPTLRLTPFTARVPLGWTKITCSRLRLTGYPASGGRNRVQQAASLAARGLLQQPRFARGRFDALVVVRTGRDEFACALQVHDL